MFDPLGFIAPFTMKAKLLLQMLSRMKIGWDDQIGEIERMQWIRWLENLPKLAELQVDRCFKPETLGAIKSVELHLFSDASRVGYSAVAYLRLVDVNGCIHCAFVMGKARLAPIQSINFSYKGKGPLGFNIQTETYLQIDTHREKYLAHQHILKTIGLLNFDLI
jgi:hypothetical protein